jgi:hypothetical protein
MAAARAQQISGHLNYPKGLLHGQVAIITGMDIHRITVVVKLRLCDTAGH